MFVLPASAHEQLNAKLIERKAIAGSSVAVTETLEYWNTGTPEYLNSERRTTKIRNTKLPKTPGTQKKSHAAK